MSVNLNTNYSNSGVYTSNNTNSTNTNESNENSLEFDEVLKQEKDENIKISQEQEFQNFSKEELENSIQNYPYNELPENVRLIPIGREALEQAFEMLNKTKIHNLDTGEFQSFKEVYEGIKFKVGDKISDDYAGMEFVALASLIGGLTYFLGSKEGTLTDIDIIKKGDTVAIGIKIQGSDNSIISYAFDDKGQADIFEIIGIQMSQGENMEFKDFMEKYGLTFYIEKAKDTPADYNEAKIKSYNKKITQEKEDYEKKGYIDFGEDSKTRNLYDTLVFDDQENLKNDNTFQDNQEPLIEIQKDYNMKVDASEIVNLSIKDSTNNINSKLWQEVYKNFEDKIYNTTKNNLLQAIIKDLSL